MTAKQIQPLPVEPLLLRADQAAAICGLSVSTWHCQVCKEAGNAYQLAEIMGIDKQAILGILSKHGLDLRAGTPCASDRLPPKKPQYKAADLRGMTDEEKTAFCKVKGLDPEAFEKLGPLRVKEKEIVVIPAFEPGRVKAVGLLQARMDGKPFQWQDKTLPSTYRLRT